MLCVLVGIPKAYVPKVEARLRKSLTGCIPLSLPRDRIGGGWLQLSGEDAKAAADRMLEHQMRNCLAFANGCCVIAFSSVGGDLDEFRTHLEPTMIVSDVKLPFPLATIGTPGQIAANKVAVEVVKVATILKVAVNAVQRELSDRLTRTPLHLPIRNFTSDVFAVTVVNLARGLARSEAPTELISAACMMIESVHPFRANGNRRSFSDNDSKRFLMPGRNLHGVAHRGYPHNSMCALSSKLRIGGALPDGFHFDCVRNDNDRLEGDFPNCHGSRQAAIGAPHVNIGTNDGLR